MSDTELCDVVLVHDVLEDGSLEYSGRWHKVEKGEPLIRVLNRAADALGDNVGIGVPPGRSAGNFYQHGRTPWRWELRRDFPVDQL